MNIVFVPNHDMLVGVGIEIKPETVANWVTWKRLNTETTQHGKV